MFRFRDSTISRYLAFVSAGFLAACNETSDQMLIPGTDLHLTEVLYDDRLGTRNFVLDSPEELICRDSYLPTISWSLADIKFITGSSNFLFTARGEECIISISPPGTDISERNSANHARISAPGCDVWVVRKGESISRIEYVGTDDVDQFNRCMFRLALFAQGYSGVMGIADERLFLPTMATPWAGLSNAPAAVPTFHFSLARCGFEMREMEEAPAFNRCER